MVIDAHLHLGLNQVRLDTVQAYLDSYCIDRGWFLSWEEHQPAIPEFYHELSIRDIMIAYEKYPARIVPLYAPDPSGKDAAQKLLFWCERGVRGCGELKISLRWDEVEIKELLALVEQLNIPLVFHMEAAQEYYLPAPSSRFERAMASVMNRKAGTVMWAVLAKILMASGSLYRSKIQHMKRIFPGYLLDFAALEKSLREFPSVTFIGHGPLFWDGVRPLYHGATARLLNNFSKFYADISGGSGARAIMRSSHWTRSFLVQFQDKILYGTDNYNCGLRQYLQKLALPIGVYEKILCHNANGIIASKKH